VEHAADRRHRPNFLCCFIAAKQIVFENRVQKHGAIPQKQAKNRSQVSKQIGILHSQDIQYKK
jgi:hypothetical protein